MINTDGDKAIKVAIELVYMSEGFDVKQFLCLWHIVHRGFEYTWKPFAPTTDEYLVCLDLFHRIYHAVDDRLTDDQWNGLWKQLVDRVNDWAPKKAVTLVETEDLPGSVDPDIVLQGR